MTKLSGVIKAGTGYEIELVDGQNLLILPFGQKGTIVIDKASDEEQVLYLIGQVGGGRNKGTKCRWAIPYTAIVRIICT